MVEKIAVVTGAGSGIGAAMARALTAAGADVVHADIDGDAAARVAGSGRSAQLDVTDAAAVQQGMATSSTPLHSRGCASGPAGARCDDQARSRRPFPVVAGRGGRPRCSGERGVSRRRGDPDAQRRGPGRHFRRTSLPHHRPGGEGADVARCTGHRSPRGEPLTSSSGRAPAAAPARRSRAPRASGSDRPALPRSSRSAPGTCSRPSGVAASPCHRGRSSPPWER
jgi:hypothetical protein